MDTIGIAYTIIQHSTNYLFELPRIISPSHQSVISSDTPEIYWELDSNADGCGLILLGGTPILGEELKDIIWEKEFIENANIIFRERIPVHLANNKEYTLIIWSYTNTKLINNNWNRGSYSIEWSKFSVDTLNKNKNFVLSQNFPNPFNYRTIIRYNLPEMGNVSITIFDVIGRKITLLTDHEQSSGEHYIQWDGKDGSGNAVASVVYFYNIKFRDKSISKKMILIR